MVSKHDVASMVDHTHLSMTATQEEIERLCQEAIHSQFKAVCVRPDMVAVASRLLQNTRVLVCSVIGFPKIKTATALEMEEALHEYQTVDKVWEALSALREGAHEIDMVIDLHSLKKKDYHLVEEDIRAVVQAVCSFHKTPPLVKVIIETCYLTEEEKVSACTIAECAGAHFVKTSTGYGIQGATVQDIELMNRVLSGRVGIKASGGIHTLESAFELYQAAQRFCPHPFRIGSSKLQSAFR